MLLPNEVMRFQSLSDVGGWLVPFAWVISGVIKIKKLSENDKDDWTVTMMMCLCCSQ